MQYLLTFLEGVISFVSPCLLPMLPIYVSYFAANSNKKSKTLTNALGFVLGFSLVFIVLGAFAGTLGSLLFKYTKELNIITGLIVIVFGLNFMGVIKIGFLNATHTSEKSGKELEFFSSIIFGIVFSIGWTPCVGAFLGSALALASQQGSVLKGIVLLLTYSLGLGIPFVLSAIIIDKLKSTFNFIKRNYKIINLISGIFLVIIGILMMTGYIGYFLSLLTF